MKGKLNMDGIKNVCGVEQDGQNMDGWEQGGNFSAEDEGRLLLGL